MDRLPIASQGLDLATIRRSETGTSFMVLLTIAANVKPERQRWFSDPRDLYACDPLYQLPLINGPDIVWDHTEYRFEWERNRQPIARPLAFGGLVFNTQSQWWERNDTSWQPEKKVEGGRQTTLKLRYLGVVAQPLASGLLDKAKSLLRGEEGSEHDASPSKETPRGVPTLIAEVPHADISATAKIDLEAKSHVLYSPQRPYRLIKSLYRKGCRHPSTCSFHAYTNVDAPQDVIVPLAAEPDKPRVHESGFPLRSCQQKGHEHLAHAQDPCFVDAKEEGKEVQSQDDALEQVLGLAATSVQADELERSWQQEEEGERQQEVPLACPSRQEIRPVSISAHTLFQNAARSLQRMAQTTPEKARLRGDQRESPSSRVVTPLSLRGGSGRRRRLPGQPLSWRVREWFTATRLDPVHINRTESDEDVSDRGCRSRRVRYRISDGQEFGFDADEWARLPVLTFDDDGNPIQRRNRRPRRRRRFHAQRVETSESESDADGDDTELVVFDDNGNARRATAQDIASLRRDPISNPPIDLGDRTLTRIGAVGPGSQQNHETRRGQEQPDRNETPPPPYRPRRRSDPDTWHDVADVDAGAQSGLSSQGHRHRVVGHDFSRPGYNLEERAPSAAAAPSPRVVSRDYGRPNHNLEERAPGLRGGAARYRRYDRAPNRLSRGIREFFTGRRMEVVERESRSPPRRRERQSRRAFPGLRSTASSPSPPRRRTSPRSRGRSPGSSESSRSSLPSVPPHVDDFPHDWQRHMELPLRRDSASPPAGRYSPERPPRRRRRAATVDGSPPGWDDEATPENLRRLGPRPIQFSSHATEQGWRQRYGENGRDFLSNYQRHEGRTPRRRRDASPHFDYDEARWAPRRRIRVVRVPDSELPFRTSRRFWR